MDKYAESLSPIEKMTDDRWKRMWSIRIFTGSAILTGLLAKFVFKSGTMHALLVGMTFGVLIGLFVQISRPWPNNLLR